METGAKLVQLGKGGILIRHRGGYGRPLLFQLVALLVEGLKVIIASGPLFRPPAKAAKRHSAKDGLELVAGQVGRVEGRLELGQDRLVIFQDFPGLTQPLLVSTLGQLRKVVAELVKPLQNQGQELVLVKGRVEHRTIELVAGWQLGQPLLGIWLGVGNLHQFEDQVV